MRCITSATTDFAGGHGGISNPRGIGLRREIVPTACRNRGIGKGTGHLKTDRIRLDLSRELEAREDVLVYKCTRIGWADALPDHRESLGRIVRNRYRQIDARIGRVGIRSGHCDEVDIVAIEISRVFEIRRYREGQYSCAGDRELASVITTEAQRYRIAVRITDR